MHQHCFPHQVQRSRRFPPCRFPHTLLAHVVLLVGSIWCFQRLAIAFLDTSTSINGNARGACLTKSWFPRPHTNDVSFGGTESRSRLSVAHVQKNARIPARVCSAAGGSSFIRSVRSSVYVALFGAPYPEPGDGVGLGQLGEKVAKVVDSPFEAVSSSSETDAETGVDEVSMANAIASSSATRLGDDLRTSGEEDVMVGSFRAAENLLDPKAQSPCGESHVSVTGHHAVQSTVSSSITGNQEENPKRAGRDIPLHGTGTVVTNSGDTAGIPELVAKQATMHDGSDVAAGSNVAAYVGPETKASSKEPRPLWPAPNESTTGPADFFLFIKDYSWSLRYRISRRDDEGLDVNNPLELEWIKLRKPMRNPRELFQGTSTDIFDWAVREPPRHQGFMYQVTELVGSGVEAVINFFKGRGPSLLVTPDGIALATEHDSAGDDSGGGAAGAEVEQKKPVTHCWVEVVGLPFFPVLQSIAFFNSQEVVIDWHV